MMHRMLGVALLCLLALGQGFFGAARGEEGGVFVLGGTRDTGLETVKLLMERGDDVTALVRVTSDTSALDALGAPTVVGDALDRASLDAALAAGTYRAVISSLGTTRGDTRVDYEGNKNAVDAAKAAGIDRFILVSSLGVGDSAGSLSPQAQEALGEVLKLKEKAETYLIDSGLDYTIVRPGNLKSEPATGTGKLWEDPTVMGSINRADVAQLLLEALDDPATIGKTYGAVDETLIGVSDF